MQEICCYFSHKLNPRINPSTTIPIKIRQQIFILKETIYFNCNENTCFYDYPSK